MKFNLSNFVKCLKKINFVLAVFFLVLFSIVAYNYAPDKANAYFLKTSTEFPVYNQVTGNIINLTATGISENLSSDGVYTVTYRISNPAKQPVNFPLIGTVHRCVEGHGHLSLDGKRSEVCEQIDAPYYGYNLLLDASNNYTKDVTLTTSQVVPAACGTYQTDLFTNAPTPSSTNGFFLASIKYTDINCPEPTPTPTPTPSAAPPST